MRVKNDVFVNFLFHHLCTVGGYAAVTKGLRQGSPTSCFLFTLYTHTYIYIYIFTLRAVRVETGLSC